MTRTLAAAALTALALTVTACSDSGSSDQDDAASKAVIEAFVRWHAGRLAWAQAIRDGRIRIDGSPTLVRAFPTWNARSAFAHVRPVSSSPATAVR